METLNFSTNINAPKEKVWEMLWNDASYRQWTSAFMEGSYAQTDNWKEGSKVLFLGHGGSGMVSKVLANQPNKFMSFEHLGEVKDGVEDTTSDKVKSWAGSTENYTLEENGGITTVKIEMLMKGITDDFKTYFSNTWPKALAQLKQISEN